MGLHLMLRGRARHNDEICRSPILMALACIFAPSSLSFNGSSDQTILFRSRSGCLRVAPFLESLRSAGFEPFFISDFLETGKPSRIRTAFRTADFVIALLFAEQSLDSVFVELGIAVGLAKQIIVFADDRVKLPAVLKDIEVHYTELSDLPSLVPRIQEFIAPRTPIRMVAKHFRQSRVNSPGPLRYCHKRKRPSLQLGFWQVRIASKRSSIQHDPILGNTTASGWSHEKVLTHSG